MDIACGGKDKFIEQAQKNFENRCLHHHVFNEQCLRKSLEFENESMVANKNKVK